MGRIVYSIGFFIFSLFYIPVFFIKGKFEKGWTERFGKVPREILRDLTGGAVIWVHAVSVGEVQTARRLVSALKQRYPQTMFLYTTTTMTGRQVLEAVKAPEDKVCFFPIDLSVCLRRFLDGVRPKAVVILETEIWPNLLWELSARKIPVLIVNGRLSERSMPLYRRVRGLLKGILALFSGIGVQDDLMRERFLGLGADPAKVRVTGNLKYEFAPTDRVNELAKKFKQDVRVASAILCVAGSTHEGEEKILFGLFEQLKRETGAFQFLIAPRHLERLPAIYEEAKRCGVRVVALSECLKSGAIGPESVRKNDAMIILDKMGVLPFFYQEADLVFVGGSLVPKGGHNLVEPAFFEKPVLFGRHMENFREMAEEFKKNGAGIEVADGAQLKERIIELSHDSSRRQAMGAAAGALVRQRAGACARTVEFISECVIL